MRIMEKKMETTIQGIGFIGVGLRMSHSSCMSLSIR